MEVHIMDIQGEIQILERIRSLEKVVSKIPNLEEAVSGIQERAMANSERIDSVESEIRLQLSIKDEEIQSLRYQVDPYSNDGDSLVNSNFF
jgi:predicted  nucleic acid-binding Zn-ribbon protein